MGWKGAARSIGASIRRYEREMERQRKAEARRQAQETAAHVVQTFTHYLELLTKIHAQPLEFLDWQKMYAEPQPNEPVNSCKREQMAKIAESRYKPSFIDRLLKLEDYQRNRLKSRIARSRQLDSVEYGEAITKYHADYAEWEDQYNLACQVIAGDHNAYQRVITESSLFSDIAAFGGAVQSLEFKEKEFVVNVHVSGIDIIPEERYSLTKAGNLSAGTMPMSQRNEYYQDYVCSMALRAAGELFAALPLDNGVASICTELLNNSTGYIETVPILSVQVPRETYIWLNLGSIDASSSMSNFRHNMNFSKTRGFTPVSELQSYSHSSR